MGEESFFIIQRAAGPGFDIVVASVLRDIVPPIPQSFRHSQFILGFRVVKFEYLIKSFTNESTSVPSIKGIACSGTNSFARRVQTADRLCPAR